MEAGYVQHGRAEQLISIARVPLAVAAALVVLVEPSVGDRSRTPLLLATFYALWSIAVAVSASRSILHAAGARLATHVIDIAVATLLIAATQTPVSPLFQLYIFTIFSATLRLTIRGVILTGLATATLYTFIAVFGNVLASDPAFFATRLIHIAIATTLLGFLRRHQDRMREDLTRVAAWPRRAFDDREPLVRSALENAAAILHARRVAIVFEEDDEPWLWIALHDGAAFSMTREGPDLPVLHEVGDEATFFCADARAAEPAIAVLSDSHVARVAGAPLARGFADRLQVGAVMSAPFAGEAVQGRLFVLDRPDVTVDEMMLARIVARLIAARLDEFAFIAAARGAAAGDERLRLARNLHDTLLQSLTAVALQLENAVEMLDRDPGAARRKMHAVQELIARSQAELRTDIAGLRPRGAVVRPPLWVRLGELPLWVLQQWDVVAAIDVEPPNCDVREPLATEIFRLVNEAVANAARHANATMIRARVTLGSQSVHIVVSDDGRGLPFHGTFDLDALEAQNRGPLTLRERVSALGGTLALQSSESGTTLDMTVPL